MSSPCWRELIQRHAVQTVHPAAARWHASGAMAAALAILVSLLLPPGASAASVVQEVRRERLADGSLRTLRLSGVFFIDDPSNFVRLLTTIFNVTAERVGDSIELRRGS